VIDIDAPLYARQKQVLLLAAVAGCVSAGLPQADAEQKAASWVTGNLALLYVNAVLKATMQTALLIRQPAIWSEVCPGRTWASSSCFRRWARAIWSSSRCSSCTRYISGRRATTTAKTSSASPSKSGCEKTLTESKATFRVLGSSVMPTEGIFDLTSTTGMPRQLPERVPLRRRRLGRLPQQAPRAHRVS
jgi:hypothetical protein